MADIVLNINGVAGKFTADPSTPLIYVLRNELGLMGAKVACGLEQCGAPLSQFAGAQITTVEGLAEKGLPGSVQRAFIAEAAAQCGFCTPELIVAVEALRRHHVAPDRETVRAALTGHPCRCGSHAAVLRAVDRVLGERNSP